MNLTLAPQRLPQEHVRRMLRPSARRSVSPATWAGILIGVSAAASLLFLWVGCPLGLYPDEAHYWDWSRNLDWNYYSKGPLVAWLIRASCEVLGPLSVALTGDLAAAVRFPAVACHVAVLVAWYVLGAGIFRSPGFGLAMVAAAATLPILRVGALLITTDPPFLACWCWALVCVWRGLETGRVGLWAGAGTFTALGILAKYTMALFPVAVVAYLLIHRRPEFRRPGVWLLLAGAVLGWVPALIWNVQHDWVTFRHVFAQVGVIGTTPAMPLWARIGWFAVGQLGMMFGFWLVAFLAAGWRFRPSRETEPAVQLLWWVSVPVWCLFAATNLVKPGQANWAAPCYVGGFLLAVAWVRDQLAGPWCRMVAWWVGGSVAFGFLLVILLQLPNFVRPTIARFAPQPSEKKPFPVRGFDITARLAGWKELAAEVDAVRARVRAETGEEPVIAATHWTVPGILGCYCSGHPTVYSIGLANLSDRHSQYDVWRPNPTADAQVFRGRTFVIVGDIWGDAEAAFERHEPPQRFVHAPDGVPLAGWTIRVSHGFRGFSRVAEHPAGPKY